MMPWVTRLLPPLRGAPPSSGSRKASVGREGCRTLRRIKGIETSCVGMDQLKDDVLLRNDGSRPPPPPAELASSSSSSYESPAAVSERKERVELPSAGGLRERKRESVESARIGSGSCSRIAGRLIFHTVRFRSLRRSIVAIKLPRSTFAAVSGTCSSSVTSYAWSSAKKWPRELSASSEIDEW